ncbi:MAG TPA: hypothetical protein VJ972_12925 [Anaerolineales bacterium]|nr:hypothetical protein [Anaerolineales bacterium]
MSTNVEESFLALILEILDTLLEYWFKTPSRMVFARICPIRLPYADVVVDALEELGIICLLGIPELHINNTPHIAKEY